MDTGQLSIIMVFGIPLSAVVISLVSKWHLKAHELKVKEMQLQMEEKLRTDEMNAKILRMDDYGISPTEINQLAEEVRQLRAEVARMKQDMNSRFMGG